MMLSFLRLFLPVPLSPIDENAVIGIIRQSLMSIHSIGVAGLKTVGPIARVSGVVFRPDQTVLTMAEELLHQNLPGAAVVNAEGKYVGFISEADILEALEGEREIGKLTARDIMVTTKSVIAASTTLAEAARIMRARHILLLPVEVENTVIGCVTRQDLLREWIKSGAG